MIAVILIAAFAVTAPFASEQLPAIPAFVPAYNVGVIILDLITFVLLFAQYRELGERSFLALACGFLFTPLVAAAHGVSSPTHSAPGR